MPNFCQKNFSKWTFTKCYVSNSKLKSVTKLEVHFCKNEIIKGLLQLYKKYCWKTSCGNLLKFLDILIGNILIVNLLPSFNILKKQNIMIILKSDISSSSIQYNLMYFKYDLALHRCCWVFYLPYIYYYFIIHLSWRINMYTFKKQ